MYHNVIIVNSHDTGDFISPYGYKLPTPNLEQFAQDAILFQNAFCASPTCSPSRASMMTGTFNTTNGMLGLAHRNFNITNIDNHLATVLKNNGFHTVLCGIQHENGRFQSEEYAQRSYELGYLDNISHAIKGYESDEMQLIWDDLNAANIENYIKDYNFSKKPLFLQFGMFATHRDYPTNVEKEYKYQAKPTHFKNFREDDTQGLYKSLENMDKNFSRVLKAITDAGQLDNTIIIYTTDHGLANPFAKCFLTDQGTKVGFIMKVPNVKSTIYNNNFSHVDVSPTLLDYLGIKHDISYQGISHYKYIEDKLDEKLDVVSMVNFHTSYEPQRSLRTDRYKLICYYDNHFLRFNYSNTDKSLYKDEYLKLGFNKDKIQLYDLYFDPLETRNLAYDSNYQSVLAELLEKLDFKLNEINDFIPVLEEYKSNHKINKESCVIAGSKNEEDYY